MLHLEVVIGVLIALAAGGMTCSDVKGPGQLLQGGPASHPKHPNTWLLFFQFANRELGVGFPSCYFPFSLPR